MRTEGLKNKHMKSKKQSTLQLQKKKKKEISTVHFKHLITQVHLQNFVSPLTSPLLLLVLYSE